jgi:hypothetical protein
MQLKTRDALKMAAITRHKDEVIVQRGCCDKQIRRREQKSLCAQRSAQLRVALGHSLANAQDIDPLEQCRPGTSQVNARAGRDPSALVDILDQLVCVEISPTSSGTTKRCIVGLGLCSSSSTCSPGGLGEWDHQRQVLAAMTNESSSVRATNLFRER